MRMHEVRQPSDVGQSAPVAVTSSAESEADALEAALADMTATFSDDFANARVGKRHNTYEHRSRVLRQMTGRLAAMRAQAPVTPS